MKIVVPVKQVAALEEDFELAEDGASVDPDFLEWDLNEWDTFSLEAALQLVEAEGGEVVVVGVGHEEADEGLLACLAKGAHRAIRVEDEHGASGQDPFAVARVLAAVVAHEEADLVLCGVQSSDAVNSATGVALAAYLELPHVAVVKRIAHDAGQLTVERELEGGVVEVLRLGLPALLTVQTGINEPRYATLRAIKQAKEKPLDVLSVEDLGLDADILVTAQGARVRRLASPETGSGAEMLEGSPTEIAARIAEIVKERVSA